MKNTSIKIEISKEELIQFFSGMKPYELAGIYDSCDQCPIAVFLQEKYKDRRIEVGSCEVGIWKDDEGRKEILFRLPHWLMEVIDQIDQISPDSPEDFISASQMLEILQGVEVE
jgi:hypothetical protein